MSLAAVLTKANSSQKSEELNKGKASYMIKGLVQLN